MTARMTAGEALREIHAGNGWRGPAWENLSALPRLNWETRAQSILSDAAAIRERMGDGWQAIETAPLDTDILLGWWETWPERVWKTEAGWAGKSNTCPPSTGFNDGHFHGSATHWQPLPEPPK